MSAVAGYCPMGCGSTLFLGAGGYVTCSDLECPRPDAATTILDDAEHEHIVEIGPRTFTVRHPLRERLDDQLMDCALHDWLRARSGQPAQPGRYRVLWRSAAVPAEWIAVIDDEAPAGGAP